MKVKIESSNYDEVEARHNVYAIAESADGTRSGLHVVVAPENATQTTLKKGVCALYGQPYEAS